MCVCSYFGDDFYPSDFPRFCRERSDRLVLDPERNSWAERQAEYVLQMTEAALTFARQDHQTLLLDYDQHFEDGDALAKMICDFLRVPLSENAARIAKSKAGPVTDSTMLTRGEFELARRYLGPYAKSGPGELLEENALLESIAARYVPPFAEAELDESLEGLTTNRLRNLLRRQKPASSGRD